MRGRDIQRYRAQWAGLWLIATFPSLKLDINEYPSVKNHLLSFGKDRLEQSGSTLVDGSRSRKKTPHQWFELQDAIAYYEEFMRDKIVWKALSLEPSFCYLPSNIFINDKANLLTTKTNKVDLKFICAYLNSKVFQFQFKQVGINMGRGFEYKVQYLKRIFIPKVSPEKQQPFIHLANKILSAKDSDPKVDTIKQEAEIDQLVYSLYNLTKEEIKIVEGLN